MGSPIDTQDLLERFGLLTEEALASLIGVGPKSLKNRARSELPEFVKVGRRKLFKEDSVREFFGLSGMPRPRSSVTRIEGGIQPRGLNKEEAARYVGLDPAAFHTLVAQGQMPGATRIGNREIWDRLKLDAAFSLL